MEYEWESEFDPEVWDDLDAHLEGSKFNVVAIAVENAQTGEAAILVHPECPKGGVLMADLWQDILGDADRFYNEAVESITTINKPTELMQ